MYYLVCYHHYGCYWPRFWWYRQQKNERYKWCTRLLLWKKRQSDESYVVFMLQQSRQPPGKSISSLSNVFPTFPSDSGINFSGVYSDGKGHQPKARPQQQHDPGNMLGREGWEGVVILFLIIKEMPAYKFHNISSVFSSLFRIQRCCHDSDNTTFDCEKKLILESTVPYGLYFDFSSLGIDRLVHSSPRIFISGADKQRGVHVDSPTPRGLTHTIWTHLDILLFTVNYHHQGVINSQTCLSTSVVRECIFKGNPNTWINSYTF